MKDWFVWIEDDKLRATADLVMNGGELDSDSAKQTIERLRLEGVRLTKEYVGEDFYKKYFPSERHGSNWKNGRPIGIVDHYTAGIAADRTLKWFSNRDRGEGIGNSSAHFIIDRDGTIITVIDPLSLIAWHARGANGTHIGIEHVNAGLLSKTDEGFKYLKIRDYPKERKKDIQGVEGQPWEPYTTAQIVSNIVLKRWLVWAIPTLKRSHFVDHQQVEPKRKRDCGPLWPLDTINSLVFNGKAFRDLSVFEKELLILSDIDSFKKEVNP